MTFQLKGLEYMDPPMLEVCLDKSFTMVVMMLL